MSDKQTKFSQIIPIFNSGLKQNISWNPEYKDITDTPSYIITNYKDYLEDKQGLRLGNIGKGIKKIESSNNKILNFHKTNNTLDFIMELERITEEYLKNSQKNIISSDSENNKIINNLKNKSINNNLFNNIKFPLNLFLTKKVNFKLRNYIDLIGKFNPNLAASKNNMFKFNFNNVKFINNLYTLLHSAFISMNCLISKPRVSYINDKIFIQLFFFADSKLSKTLSKMFKDYIKSLNRHRSLMTRKNQHRNRKSINKSNINSLNLNKFQEKSLFLEKNSDYLNSLCQLLSKLFNKPVQLELTRLHYPFYDANIFVNLLSNFTSFTKIRILINKILKVTLVKRPTANIQRKRFSLLPGYLTGLTVKFAGRFPTQRVVPRKTVKIKELGSLARKKAILVENARFSNKNRRGAFSISVSTGFYLSNYIK